jgi:hypothetical protein
MESLIEISHFYEYVIAAFSCLFLLLLIYRTYRILWKKTPRTPLFSIKGSWYPKVLKLLFAVSMLCIFVNAPVYTYIASAFKPLVAPYWNHVLVLCAMWLALWEFYLSFSLSEKLIKTSWKKVVLTVLVVIFFPLSLVFTSAIPGFFSFPTVEESYLIELPVQGTWLAGHAGESVGLNVHNHLKAQEYAIDMVKVNERGAFFEDSGTALSHFYTYNAPIYAPVSGKVVAMVDTLPNSAVSMTSRDTITPEGNHVVIEFAPQRYLFLAHLNTGTVEVEKGDLVNAGDLIGKAGNSGNSSWPHLHIHIQDKPFISNNATQGYPFRFTNIERKRWMGWERLSNAFIIRNDLFSK